MRTLIIILASAIQVGSAWADVVNPLPFDLLYVRAPRPSNGPMPGHPENGASVWPDTVRPLTPDAGAVLVRLRPDGTRQVIFPLESHRPLLDTPGGSPLSVGSVSDPNVSFDGQRVLLTWYHDLTTGNPQRGGLSAAGADLYVLDLGTLQAQRLTTQRHTPNLGNGANFGPGPNSNLPRIGVFNTGGTWAPGGTIVFTSTRNNVLPPKVMDVGQRTLQLFRMDADGANPELVGHLNLAMALHPQVLADGRIMFSSWEEQGLRDERNFPLWIIEPDGRAWNSLSGFAEFGITHHFATQMPGGDIVVTRYYNLNNNGFGDLIRYPLDPPGPDFLTGDPPPFGPIPFARRDPGQPGELRRVLTPWTTPDDFPAPCPGREHDPYGSAEPGQCAGTARRGKVTQPVAVPPLPGVGGPAAEILVAYSPGPANHNGIYQGTGTAFPWYHGEIRLIPDGSVVPTPPANVPGPPSGMPLVVRELGFNLQWPRPVVPWSALHGASEPPLRPGPNDSQIIATGLVPGEPFGLVGSSSLIWRETEPALGPWWGDRDPWNPGNLETVYSWVRQGADAGVYGDDDIWGLRVLAMEPQTDRSYPWNSIEYLAVGGERLRILGEVPTRGAASGKPPGATSMLPDGSIAPDTSFLVKLPADVPFTFQTIDRNGLTLNMAQTWHQLRPGEARWDCGGCHAHSKQPMPFPGTAASSPTYPVRDLARTTPLFVPAAGGGEPTVQAVASPQVTVEYFADVLPVFESRCASCHGASSPAAGLPLTAAAGTIAGWPATIHRLLFNGAGAAPPVQPTRLVRSYQARQSLLVWALWGARLDGRSNADRPDDLDFAGHPPIPGLSSAERLTVARWIDLGTPVELVAWNQPGQPPGQQAFWGFHEDDLRPTLVVRPAADAASEPVSVIQISAFDTASGVNPATLRVTASHALGGVPAGTNLAAGLALDPSGSVASLSLPSAIPPGSPIVVTVRVRDHAGNETVVERRWRMPGDLLFANGFEAGGGAGTAP
ncbi:MAG: hypothetical protein KF823_06910 [Xanthomonadales bacterium]|nr:hypothetical protein [Xanthomonadales bacterium]